MHAEFAAAFAEAWLPSLAAAVEESPPSCAAYAAPSSSVSPLALETPPWIRDAFQRCSLRYHVERMFS